MGDHHFSRSLRIISALVLSFFCWTFAGGVDVAYAVKSSSQPSAISKQQTATSPSHGEKFSKDIEDIDSVLKDTSTDTDTKRLKLRGKKAEIDADDVEIRKQFSDTEAKIKDLPIEIQQRHRDFVQKYEDNLKTLRDDLDEIDKATTESEKEQAIQKAQEFLDKVKPPQKKSHFDPNKLPHRSAEPVFNDPRTKPEEFEKESGQQLAVSPQPKPLLVASNGPLTGLLSSDSKYSTQNSKLETQNYLQIALANPPTAADLAENGIEIQFTDAIKAKAAELNHNPVKIYNWVRNNIEYAPTYGSIQGADYCLQTKLCNDTDTASLLIALLRTSGIHAHYVYGTIQLPMEKVKNWVGGFTESKAALNLMASGGIPVGGITEGGQIAYVQMEHVWVEAYVDVIPSQGAVHRVGDMWVPLDPSFKQYEYTHGMDLAQSVPIDVDSFLNQIKSTAVLDPNDGSVSKIDNNYINATVGNYSSQIADYIKSNYGDKTGADIIGKKRIIQSSYPILFQSLPYKVIVVGRRYSAVPNSYRHLMSFFMTDEFDSVLISYSVTLPQVAGKRISLSFSPASPSDESTIASYYDALSIPAYLVYLKPELRIDGLVVSSGGAVQMGTLQNLSISLSGPVASWNESIPNSLVAGEYYEIGLNLSGSIGQKYNDWLQAVRRITTAISSGNIESLNGEDIQGQSLEGIIKGYFNLYNVINFTGSKQASIVKMILPSMGMAVQCMTVEYMWGVPSKASAGGIAMDVDRMFSATFAQDGDKTKAIAYTLQDGIWSSILEHMVPEIFQKAPDNTFESISAIKALQIANDLSIPILQVDKSNFASRKTLLSVGNEVMSSMENAVNAGAVVITPVSSFSYRNWAGIGYIILNPVSGSGAYMVGGLGGSEEVDTTPTDIAADFGSFLRLALHCNMEGIGMSKGVLAKSAVFGKFITFFGTIMEIFDAVFQGDYTINRARSVGMSLSNSLIDYLLSKYILDELMAKFVACVMVWADCAFSALFWVSFAFTALFAVKKVLDICLLQGQCFASNMLVRRGFYYA